MKKAIERKKIIIKITLNIIVSLILFSIIFFVRFEIDHYIIDSFTLTGLVFLLFAALKFVISEGVFNSIEWSLKKFSDFFRKIPKYNYKYHDFIALKNEKDRPLLWPTVLIGGIYFGIGLIMIMIG